MSATATVPVPSTGITRRLMSNGLGVASAVVIILVVLIAMFPWYIQWAPNAIWKTFDLFVGLIQAFIFSLLTILYFSQSMELEHDEH